MSLSAPPLTVALLTYNRLHYLKESIAAILEQSYSEFELLVLDNYSTDGTAEFVLGLQDPRIRYVRNASNLSSVEFNCRSAYHIASAPRVIVTHDDDIMENDMLERQMHFLDHNPEVRLAWVRVSDIDQDGRPIAQNTAIKRVNRIFGAGEYITSFLRERLWPMPSGVMLVRAALPGFYSVDAYLRRAVSPGNPLDAAGIEDVLMPARINRRHAIGYLDQPLLRRRVHTDQFSHAASLSRPGVYLYRDLKRIARGVPGLEAEALHFDACTVRFDIQEAITTQQAERVGSRLSARVGRVAAKLKANRQSAPDACLAGLPIILLDYLLVSKQPADELGNLNADNHASATGTLLAWARQRAHFPRANVLAALNGRRIVLFGSAFVAALLILEAKKGGHQVIACVDSNVNRQGRALLGVPIQPLVWMRDHVKAEDAVVITSERDHEHYIAALIQQNLSTQACIVSWKELVG